LKVRCVKLTDSRGNPVEHSTWMTLGKVYHVLSISCETQQKLRLIGDGLNGVALFPLDDFEIVSSKIPAAWIVVWDSSRRYFALTTEAWNQPGFWDRYYERDPTAIRIFDEENEKIINADQPA
jgi:hypothetical protein